MSTPAKPVPSPPPVDYPEQSQAVTAFVLGVISVVTCWLLGPFAWKLGHEELRAIAEGRRPPNNQGLAQAGKVCGIIGTAILGVYVLLGLFIVGAILLSAAGSAGDWTRS